MKSLKKEIASFEPALPYGRPTRIAGLSSVLWGSLYGSLGGSLLKKTLVVAKQFAREETPMKSLKPNINYSFFREVQQLTWLSVTSSISKQIHRALLEAAIWDSLAASPRDTLWRRL